MKLITISGLDGSGKSTQIKELQKYLDGCGFKTKYFHAVDFSIANKILKNKRISADNNPGAVVQTGYFKILLRKIALVIDVFRFRKYFLMLARDTEIDFLLADRCFCDQVVNIFYLEKKLAILEKMPWWLKLVEEYAIIPDLKIYLKTSSEIILSRKREIEQGQQYLIDKEKIYNWLTRRWHLKLIDGNQKKEDVFKEILTEYQNI